jgi:ABC-type sugar transport system ATPase subunit
VARIVIENLVKTFGAYAAVNGINLEIRDGEFLIMVGPSGCGKTTTLNMISGLEAPTSGDAERIQGKMGLLQGSPAHSGRRGGPAA